MSDFTTDAWLYALVFMIVQLALNGGLLPVKMHDPEPVTRVAIARTAVYLLTLLVIFFMLYELAKNVFSLLGEIGSYPVSFAGRDATAAALRCVIIGATWVTAWQHVIVEPGDLPSRAEDVK